MLLGKVASSQSLSHLSKWSQRGRLDIIFVFRKAQFVFLCYPIYLLFFFPSNKPSSVSAVHWALTQLKLVFPASRVGDKIMLLVTSRNQTHSLLKGSHINLYLRGKESAEKSFWNSLIILTKLVCMNNTISPQFN